MERNFTGPKVGDEYRIQKHRDKGGYPVIRVLGVHDDFSITVLDIQESGDPAPSARECPDGIERTFNPRLFHDSEGWPKLRKHWKRNKAKP